MNTTAAIFFLVLGQADGGMTAGTSAGGLAVIPAHYTSQSDCEAAGEAARANNLGLSFLSYTCVPAEVNAVEPARVRVTHLQPHGASFTAPRKAPATAPGPKCFEVCEVSP